MEKTMKLKINGLNSPAVDTEAKLSIIYPDGEFSSQKSCRVSVSDGKNTVFEKEFSGDGRSLLPLRFDMRKCTEYEVSAASETESGRIYSAKTSFRTGMLGDVWAARWITAENCRRRDEILSAVYLRRGFSVKGKPERAVLYISGLGYFEAHINGSKVGDDLLSTPYTAYDKRILYRVFDVTDMLVTGENAIGVILGNGFYNCITIDEWQTNTAPWRDVPKLACELHIEYGDGTEIVKTDRTWSAVKGPITFNSIRNGEEYDARLENDGWDKPGYAGETLPCRMAKAPGSLMFAAEIEPIRVREKLHPVLRRKVRNGWLYELEKDVAGICRTTFSGKAGTSVTIRYCDYLTDDGELNQEALSGFVKNYKFQTDVYTKKSDGKETWHPIFAYHGFQYIEVSGCEVPPELDEIEVWAMCTDYETKGGFSCSDPVVDRIQEMCLASTQSCCYGTLAADAVREKISWTGDVGLSCEQLLINYGAENLMAKWQADLRDAIRTGGGLPCIIPTTGWGFNSINGPDWSHPVYEVPWQLYMATGDKRYLEENLETLRMNCEYVLTMAEDDGTVNYGLGDWCAPFEGAAISVNMEKFKCPVTVTDTAFYYSALKHLVRFAEITGKDDIAEKYSKRAAEIKRVFREKFFDRSTYTVYGDCQTATGVTVYHGLCEEDEIVPLANRLLEQIHRDGDCLDFGVLGMKAVLDTLGRTGHSDTALAILTRPEYPSVKHWMDMGATVMWECWNGLGSHNQHMFTAVSAFFYKYIAGIYCSAPAGREIIFRPGLDSGLDSASGYIRTPYGKAECKWDKKAGTARITVPSSCRGTLVLNGTERELQPGVHEFAI
ncbi:MAG: family 78 glycoside hydrolase catalytic domain [Clostridia bacterium]|nr:family 78 glycoside hydrolase catalytic domain [Clostridia bacterium]